MDRVIDATARLLTKRDYAEITIADIVKESGAGASSIYARFADKRAILLAVHQRVRGRAVERFENLCCPERWTQATVHAALSGIVSGMLDWYRENHHVIKAALLLNDEVIYKHIAEANHAGAVQLSYFILDRTPGWSRQSSSRAADFIFRMITAAFQQIALFYPQAPTADTLSDDELIDGVVRAANAQLSQIYRLRDQKKGPRQTRKVTARRGR